MKALVYGASGSVGQEVLQQLVAQKVKVHAVRRHESNQNLTNPSVQWFAHDVVHGPGPQSLWEGITHVFVMSPPGYADQSKILLPIIAKAQEHKVQKLVLMTAMGANHAVGSPMQRSEEALKLSGLNYAIIRPNWFLQNFHSYWGETLRRENTLFVPGGKAKVSFIDVRDIGEVAAKLLTGPQCGEFDLTGAEALTHEEVARILSEQLGRTIKYVDAEPQVFKSHLLKAALPADYADFMLLIFGALREGYAAGITSNVQEILHRKPRTLTDYARDFRQQLETFDSINERRETRV